MHFQQPMALWFLPLLAVPLLLHLVNLRRYRVIPFPNVLVLTRLKEEEQQRNKLKHRLILASRTLALLALILFFAGPRFSDNRAAIPLHHSIFIDNSPSMLLASENGDGLQDAIQRARAYIESLPEESKVQVLTGEFFSADQVFSSKQMAFQRLNQISGGAPSRSISEVVQRQRLSLDEEKKIRRLLVSDFQRNTLVFPEQADSLGPIGLLPVGVTPVQNVSVDSVWVSSPVLLAGTEVEITAQLKNHGTETLQGVEVFFRLLERELPPVIADLSGNTLTQVVFKARLEKAGWAAGSVYINADGYAGDNRLDFGFFAGKKIRVVELRGPGGSPAFERLYSTDPLIDFSVASENSVSSSLLEKADFLVLNQPKQLSTGLLGLLKQLSEQGRGMAWVFGKEGQFIQASQGFSFETSAVDLQACLLSKPDLSNPFFEDVFSRQDPTMNVPMVFPTCRISSTSMAIQPILTTERGLPVLSQLKSAQSMGQHWIFSMDLSHPSNEFVQHPLFVPMALKMAYQSTFKAIWHFKSDADVVLQVQKAIETQDPVYTFSRYGNAADTWIGLRSPKGNMDEVRPGRGNLGPGLYQASLKTDTVAVFGISQAGSESEMVFYSQDSLSNIIKQAAHLNQFVLVQGQEWIAVEAGFLLSPQFWLILLGLLALALEILWFNIWK